ncbi:SDR family NAD(P)-dependent oxidoreductase [Catenulispora rubra]|uniref:SDR family NAD(P)-dependent oxidoreductase n=1 Tax=Catenulispora rubra TaxID=280293 RepID=UPI00189241D8|nr:SDR family NAD(P)-dependent oxidoreductase [Catenulispora rubra]
MTHARIVLITGATDGLGRALAHRLAAGGDTVLLHGRDQARLDATADAVRDEHGIERPATFRADLAELAQVRELAAAVRGATDRLDVLVSNAGIGGGEPDGRDRRESKDGYELRFAVNYLAGFLLTQELLPLLRASAPARVVNVASLGQQDIEFDDVMLERGYSGIRAYCQSKLAQISSTVEMAERVPASEVTFNSLHPATYMPTKMVLLEAGHSIDSLETGVEATARLVTDPRLAGVSGRFYDRQRETRALAQAYDKRARAELYQLSLKLVGLPAE